jgi:hypothetical protein
MCTTCPPPAAHRTYVLTALLYTVPYTHVSLHTNVRILAASDALLTYVGRDQEIELCAVQESCTYVQLLYI